MNREMRAACFVSSAKRIHNEEKTALGSAGGQREGLGELGKGKPVWDGGMMQKRLVKNSVSNGCRRELGGLSKPNFVCVE